MGSKAQDMEVTELAEGFITQKQEGSGVFPLPTGVPVSDFKLPSRALVLRQ